MASSMVFRKINGWLPKCRQLRGYLVKPLVLLMRTGVPGCSVTHLLSHSCWWRGLLALPPVASCEKTLFSATLVTLLEEKPESTKNNVAKEGETRKRETEEAVGAQKEEVFLGAGCLFRDHPLCPPKHSLEWNGSVQRGKFTFVYTSSTAPNTPTMSGKLF